MKAKLVRLVSIVCLFALVLTACSSASTPASTQPAATEAPAAATTQVAASEPVEIEVFTRFADGASKAFFDETAASFMGSTEDSLAHTR